MDGMLMNPADAESLCGVETLYAPGESIFGAAAPTLVELGWSVYPQDRYDRTPSKVNGKWLRWREDHDLANRLPSPEAMATWLGHCARDNVACVMGPGSGNAIAVDIDVPDDAAVGSIVDIADDILGYTPFRREGNAPKIALVYRAKDGVRVASTSRRLANRPGEMVEILGAGKSLTVLGVHHKTGCYIKWLDRSPLLAGPDAAPEVTPEQVTRFFEAVHAKFPLEKGAQATATRAGTEIVDRGEGIRVAKPLDGEWGTDQNGRVVDGRETYLFAMCLASVRANVALLEGGEDGAAFTARVASAVAELFENSADASGRWEPRRLLGEAKIRVERLVTRHLSGERRIQPLREAQAAKAAAPAAGAAAGRPIIKLEAGEIGPAVDATEAALIASSQGLYQRGGDIVRVGETPVMTASGREISTQRIFEVGDNALLEQVARVAVFTRYDARKNEEKRVDPPMWVAKSLRERKGHLGLPILVGVTSSPTLRPDGSVLAAEGYDAATGLLLDTRGVAFPTIPESPSKEQADAALALLRNLVSTFPFVANAHRSVALSCLLTAVVRRSLRTAPMHAFTAPTPGSGKSTLVDLAAILATGREAPVIAQGANDEEDEKRLGATLLGGDPIINWDNCERPLGGPLLNQLLTQTTVKPRILGRSEAPELPTTVLVCGTGNNLILHGDMGRRALLCTLDPGVERPELRQFSFDPTADAKEKRGAYVAAALTVLRAYIVAGRPAKRAPLLSFAEWSGLVREALIWLGEADPCDTIEEVRALDPKLDALSSVVAQWRSVIGERRVTVRDVITAATEGGMNSMGRIEFRHADLREALLGVAGDGGAVSSKRLGKWLTAHMGRRCHGSQLVRAGIVSGIQTWRLDGEGLQQQEEGAAEVVDFAQAQAAARTGDVSRRRAALETAAIERFGNEEKARLWLSGRHPAFARSPADMCADDHGLAACHRLLEMIPAAKPR